MEAIHGRGRIIMLRCLVQGYSLTSGPPVKVREGVSGEGAAPPPMPLQEGKALLQGRLECGRGFGKGCRRAMV